MYTNAKTFPSVQMHARIDVSISSLRVSSAQRYFNRTPRTAKMSQFVVPLNLVRHREMTIEARGVDDLRGIWKPLIPESRERDPDSPQISTNMDANELCRLMDERQKERGLRLFGGSVESWSLEPQSTTSSTCGVFGVGKRFEDVESLPDEDIEFSTVVKPNQILSKGSADNLSVHTSNHGESRS